MRSVFVGRRTPSHVRARQKVVMWWCFAVAVVSFPFAGGGCALVERQPPISMEESSLEVAQGLEVRRTIVRNPRARGTVLFLHGFPETSYAWKEISLALGDQFEVHAFDWPGYGLSSRPPVERFAYAPQDYARVLQGYIARSGIDGSKLLIYATDIGALPALLLAVDNPRIAKTIVVGDFAPFDRPEYMYPSLQDLKTVAKSDATRAYMNSTREEIISNAFYRGLGQEERFDIPQEFIRDMSRGWAQGAMTTADAFYHYYSYFTRDQNFLEANLSRLKTPLKVVWGEKDIYIRPDMGTEFAQRTGSELLLLPNIGHYPHLQQPRHTVEQVRRLMSNQ